MQGRHQRGPTMVSGATAVRDEYHELLVSHPQLAERSQTELEDAHRQFGLRIQGRPLCNVLRPRFITSTDRDQLSYVSGILSGLLERAGSMLLSNDHAMDRIGASDDERDIWTVDPGYEGIALTSRLDSFWGVSGLRFIEYNAESPAAIGFCDCLTRIFEKLPAMLAWEGFSAQEHNGREHLLRLLVDAYVEWGGTGVPTVAITDWQDVITRRDFELCAEHFRERGVQTLICDPRSLEYRAGKLWLGDQAITLVYRRVLLHELLEKAEEAQQLLRAYREGAVCMVNSPRSKLLHKKILFAYLSDRSLGLPLSQEEADVVHATVPWTRCVRSGQVTFHGNIAELSTLLTDEKDRFVLKPVDDYGGRGVVLGWESDTETWQRALDVAATSNFVVQERVDIPEEPFPVWADGRLAFESLMLDTDPLLFRGQTGPILTRLSGSALLNVTAGSGSTTPTFVVEGQ